MELKEDSDEEVLKPAPFTDQELRILSAANSMPVEKLTEIILVYERLANQSMLDALVRVLVRRAPNHPEALRLKALVEVEEEVRDPAYLDRLVARLEAGTRLEAVEQDAFVTYCYTLSKDGRGPEAVKLLRLLERTCYPKGTFNPHLLALAVAHRACQDFDEARAVFEKVAADNRFPEATRFEAARQVPLVKLDRRIQLAREEMEADLERGVTLSEEILRDGKTYSPAIDFRVECLTYAGRQREAIAMLEEMRASWPVPTFLFLPSLGYALFADKQFDASYSTFENVQSDSSFTSRTRAEATSMLGRIAIAKVINEGLEALNRRDFATAEVVLARLESEFSNDVEVLGYRAAFLARTEKSDEALRILHEAKSQAAAQGKVFINQDVIADVLLLRKEFDAARGAYREILDSPRYDFSMKVAARKGLINVDKEELIFAGYNDISWGRMQAARKKEAEALALSKPEDKEMKMFAADLLLAENKPDEALAKFEEVRAAGPPDQPFPGMNGLAAAHLRRGEWEEANEGYREIATGSGYLAQEKFEALPKLRATSDLIHPTLRMESRFLTEAEGDAARLQGVWHTAWSHNTRAIVRARQDWIDLDAASILGARNSSRAEAEVSLQHRFRQGYFGEVTAGGSQDGDFIYGARAGRFPNDGVGWSIGWSGNARATESLPLEVLNGREDRLDAEVGGKLNPRMNFSLGGWWHQVRVDGQSLGHGYGLSGTFDVVLQTETATRPEISVGWFGVFTRFTSDSSADALVDALATSDEVSGTVAGDSGNPIDALVDPKTHRQGLQLTVRGRLGDDVNFFTSVGGYYELEDKALNFMGAAGIEWYLSDSALLYAELRYDSSGRGASAAQGVWEASMGGKITF